MVNKDYIMRLIEQLSQAIAKILFNVENKNYEAAINEINLSYKGLTGLDPSLVNSLSDQEIIFFLTKGRTADSEKYLVIARLLRAEAELNEITKKDFNDALEKYQKSLSLYLEFFLNNIDATKNYSSHIEFILARIKSYTLPLHIKYKLFRYYELIGEYSKTEDILFELVDSKYPDIISEGKNFFQRLSQKSDGELSAGNLPREELKIGIDDLNKKSVS